MAFHHGRKVNKTPEPHDPRHYDGHDLEALFEAPRYVKWLLGAFAPHLGGRVIEVGAGIGNVSLGWIEGASEALLVEPAENLHGRLARRVAGRPRVTTACGVLEDLDLPSLGAPFDAALMVNVLEHIPDDRAALSQLHGALEPGGRLLLFVPALPWLYGSLDTLVQHCRRYTRDSLGAAVREAGFEIEELRYCDVLGALPWWFVGRVLRRQHFDPASVRLYDRVGVPLTASIEARIVPPLGKSLRCIARKSLS